MLLLLLTNHYHRRNHIAFLGSTGDGKFPMGSKGLCSKLTFGKNKAFKALVKSLQLLYVIWSKLS